MKMNGYLASRNWNQSSIKYDGLLYKFEKEKLKFHAGLSLNNNLDNTLEMTIICIKKLLFRYGQPNKYND